MTGGDEKSTKGDNNIVILDLDLLMYNVILTDFIKGKYEHEFLQYLAKTWPQETRDLFWKNYYAMKQTLFDKTQ